MWESMLSKVKQLVIWTVCLCAWESKVTYAQQRSVNVVIDIVTTHERSEWSATESVVLCAYVDIYTQQRMIQTVCLCVNLHVYAQQRNECYGVSRMCYGVGRTVCIYTQQMGK